MKITNFHAANLVPYLLLLHVHLTLVQTADEGYWRTFGIFVYFSYRFNGYLTRFWGWTYVVLEIIKMFIPSTSHFLGSREVYNNC